MRRLLILAIGLAVALPGTAGAAVKHCAAPGEVWERATPAEAGMDAAKVSAAVDYAMTTGTSSAVRVYRYGCLVAGSPDTAPPWQSFSLAKSIVSLTFGRAWTLGLISPDDPLGSLFPQADAAHGALPLRRLLTMTTGLSLITAHDLNLEMPDRVRDTLTLPFVAKPGATWAYWQSGPPTIATAVGVAAGEDFQDFAQRELFTPIGIAPGTWSWLRNPSGQTAGFWGLTMTADQFARFGELLRRGGVWNGRRLLSRQYVRQAVTPVRAFGCYGLFIWLQAQKRCNWSTFLGLPEDMWQFNGASGQIVTGFPSLGLMIARTGVDASQGTNWTPGAGNDGGEVERSFYDQLLSALGAPVAHPPLDARLPTAKQQVRGDDPDGNAAAGGATSLVQPELPPAGPRRARAVLILSAGRRGVRVHCPPVGPGRCRGTLRGAGAHATYAIARGATRRVPVKVRGRVRLTATSPDGTRTTRTLKVKR